MSNERIWRIDSLWLGKESTAWTEASAFTWIPLTTMGYIKPVIEYSKNESWVWRIENMVSREIVKQMSETIAEWRVWALTFWHLLTALFWTASAPATIETSVYKHSFTVTNTNNHKSYSIITDWTAQELSLYNLLDKISITAEVWNVINFSSTFKGKIWATTTWKVVSFTSERPFKVCWMTMKFADNVAWLTAASAIPMTSLKFEVSKNVTDITESWSCTPTSFHNQSFWITWDLELVYRADTYKWYVTWWTNKAMRVTITWSTLIGATKYEELNFDFWLISFDEWDRSNKNDDIQTQTLWFTWLYSLADSAMLTWYIQNTQSSSY